MCETLYKTVEQFYYDIVLYTKTFSDKYIEDIYFFAVNSINIFIDCNETFSILRVRKNRKIRGVQNPKRDRHLSENQWRQPK